MDRQEYIAQTILQQIDASGGNPLMAWRARNYVSLEESKEDHGYVLGGIMFQITSHNLPVGGKVVVYLMADDTYTVRVCRIIKASVNDIKWVDGVYFDNLKDIIDHILNREEK